MKVTGIELLQMVKDKKIEVGTKIIDGYGFKYNVAIDSENFIYIYDEFNKKEAGCSNFLNDKYFKILFTRS